MVMKKKGKAKDETLSILEHLRKEIPGEVAEEEKELEDEEDEDDFPKVIPPTKVLGGN